MTVLMSYRWVDSGCQLDVCSVPVPPVSAWRDVSGQMKLSPNVLTDRLWGRSCLPQSKLSHDPSGVMMLDNLNLVDFLINVVISKICKKN